jgi:general secretion pathway protein K
LKVIVLRLRTLVSARNPVPQRSTADAGFTLVIVLGLMALLAVVSVIVTRSVKAHIRAASRYAAVARAQTLAESGIAAVSADLRRNYAKPSASTGQQSPREPIICNFGDGGSVALRVFDAGGRIDLNSAPAPLFEALLSGLGADAGLARDIGNAIEAYRASRIAATAQQRAKVDPAPLPFDTEEAITQVSGITPQLARAMMPYITVHSGVRGLDPLAADPKLLALLQGGNLADLPQALVGSSTRQTFIISAVARSAEGGVYGQEAVVRMSRDKRFPMGVEIRSWRPAVFDATMTPPPKAEGLLCTTDGLFTQH